jgi:3-oxoacyl-[acyl-carrier protein] reductase
MDLGLRGRRAAVAAGSAGLGLGAAKALATEGVRVAICGRDAARLESAAAEIDSLAAAVGGEACTTIVADVGDADKGAVFVADAIDALGGVDILVTNAGGPPPGNFASTAIEQYAPALELNLLSVVGMCSAAVPAMRERGWGRIVAITSYGVRQPLAGLILSNTARTGATAFLKTLAREVAGDGVTVNSVQPGIHRTARIVQLYGADPDASQLGIPAGIIGDADDFGAVVAFVCSEQARFLTGAAIPVDGGAYAGLM